MKQIHFAIRTNIFYKGRNRWMAACLFLWLFVREINGSLSGGFPGIWGVEEQSWRWNILSKGESMFDNLNFASRIYTFYNFEKLFLRLGRVEEQSWRWNILSKGEIIFASRTNTFYNFNKYILQFGEIISETRKGWRTQLKMEHFVKRGSYICE